MLFFRRPLMLMAPDGDGSPGSGTPEKKEEKKPEPEKKTGTDGRTVDSLLDEQARQGADIGKIKAHLGIDELLADGDKGGKAKDDDEGEGGGDLESILSDGLSFGDDDEEDDEQAAA